MQSEELEPLQAALHQYSDPRMVRNRGHTCASNWEVSEACARLPEETHDEGAGEQGDEGQAVTQRGQNLHHPVEEQLHTNTQTCLPMEDRRVHRGRRGATPTM